MKQIYYSTWRAMNCDVSAQLETEADGKALLGGLPAEVEAIEARLSRFRANSELMALNARAGQWVTASDVLFENVRAAKQASRLTDGMFNPLVLPALVAAGYDRSFPDIRQPETTHPVPAADWRGIGLRPTTHEVRIPAGSALDLGGVAKGWTAARLADELAAYGPCLVNVGGDLVARGAPQNLPGWEVIVEDPFDRHALVTLWLRDAALVTSGTDFRRWTSANGVEQHHIVDPRTGSPAETDVLTVTVHHRHAPTAEAYAKAVLLGGAQAGLDWLQSQWNAAGLVVRRDGAVLATADFTDLVQQRTTV